MSSNKIRLSLNNDELCVVNKIAHNSKMDVWFMIVTDTDKDGVECDWVFDIENNRRVTLRFGVRQLYEGITDYKEYGLSNLEIDTFKNLLDKLGIKTK